MTSIPLTGPIEFARGEDPGVASAEDELAFLERSARVDTTAFGAGLAYLDVADHRRNLRPSLAAVIRRPGMLSS